MEDFVIEFVSVPMIQALFFQFGQPKEPKYLNNMVRKKKFLCSLGDIMF